MFSYSSSTAATGKDDCDENLNLIEVHSAPNLLINEELHQSNVVSKLSSSPQMRSRWDLESNDSFLQIEKMVSDLCENTNDIVEQISKKRHDDQEAIQSIPSYAMDIRNNHQTEGVQHVENLAQKIERPHKPADAANVLASAANVANTELFTVSTKQKTTHEIFTISSQERFLTPISKTPGIPVSQKKFQKHSKKSSFGHIISPVSAYIHNSPVVPLVTNVYPKKPLIAFSDIPEPIKSVMKPNFNNKENFRELPFVAYKAAKETLMVSSYHLHNF